jgi:hypothetical protein
MQKLNTVRNALSNKSSRAAYDEGGIEGLKKHLNSVQQTADVLNDLIIGPWGLFLIIVATIIGIPFIISALLFFVFVALRVDGSVGWTYFVVAIPLWLMDLFLIWVALGLTIMWMIDLFELVTSPTETTDGDATNSDPREKIVLKGSCGLFFIKAVSLWLATAMVITFQIFIFFKVKNMTTWTWADVFIFWWVLETDIFAWKTIHFYRNMQAYYEYTQAAELERGACTYFICQAAKQYYWCVVRIWFSIFIVLQADRVFTLNWALIFLPLFLGFGIYYLCAKRVFYWKHPMITETKTEETLNRIIFLMLLFMGIFALATCGMFVRRENGTHYYSMVNVLTPIYVMLAILIPAWCCYVCVKLPNMMSTSKTPTDDRSQDATANKFETTTGTRSSQPRLSRRSMPTIYFGKSTV